MKGISSFVATVLLIGFTVAVGAILSAWFMSYTRTTTAGVSSGTACASTRIDVHIPSIPNSNTTLVLLRNLGPANVLSGNLTVICGTSSRIQSISSLPQGSQQVINVDFSTVAPNSCNTDYSNVQASFSGNCEGGGTIFGNCIKNGCKPS